MARATTGARNIAVDGGAYHWRARGVHNGVSLVVWPAGQSGPMLTACFEDDAGVGREQVVVTARLVRRVINLARSKHGYDPNGDAQGTFNLPRVTTLVQTADAIRAHRWVDFPNWQ